MANSIITQDRQLTTGTITKYSGVAGILGNVICYKIGNIVHVSARIHTMDRQQSSGYFFVIPDGFRPRTLTNVMGSMVVNENDVGRVPLFASIGTDGNVEIFYSTAYTCDQVSFAGTYSI